MTVWSSNWLKEREIISRLDCYWRYCLKCSITVSKSSFAVKLISLKLSVCLICGTLSLLSIECLWWTIYDELALGHRDRNAAGQDHRVRDARSANHHEGIKREYVVFASTEVSSSLTWRSRSRSGSPKRSRRSRSQSPSRKSTSKSIRKSKFWYCWW